MAETPGSGGASSDESGGKLRGTLAPKTGKAAADAPDPAATSGRLRGTLRPKATADTSPAAPEAVPADQYSAWAGQNQIAGAGADKYGNASGSQYDLIQDGSVREAKVVVLNQVSWEITLNQPKAALERKGFTLIELRDGAGLPEQLADAAEFWIISGREQHLTPAALDAIVSFFNSDTAIRRSYAKFSAPCSARARLPSSPKITSNTQCSPFLIPQWPRINSA